MAMECLDLVSETELKKSESFEAAKKSLEVRKKLWDFISQRISIELLASNKNSHQLNENNLSSLSF